MRKKGRSPLFCLSENDEAAAKRVYCASRALSAENEAKIRTARDGLDEVLSRLESSPDADSLRAFNRSSLFPGVVRLATDQKPNEAEVFIYGDIGGGWFDDGVDAEGFAKEIAALDVDVIKTRINSGGGIVFDGVAIYNALVRHRARVVIEIEGWAASIASVIAMAGDEIRISEGSQFMIHKPWSFVVGNATDMRKEADILDKLESGLIDIYEARTDNSRDQLQTWVNAETWFKGREAVDAGFADAVIPSKTKEGKKAASGLTKLFRNAPEELLACRAGNSLSLREMERFLREGEGLSRERAKRIAAAFVRLNREDSPRSRRDAGFDVSAFELGRLTGFMEAMK